jgi:hypothetical protein
MEKEFWGRISKVGNMGKEFWSRISNVGNRGKEKRLDDFSQSAEWFPSLRSRFFSGRSNLFTLNWADCFVAEKRSSQ